MAIWRAFGTDACIDRRGGDRSKSAWYAQNSCQICMACKNGSANEVNGDPQSAGNALMPVDVGRQVEHENSMGTQSSNPCSISQLSGSVDESSKRAPPYGCCRVRRKSDGPFNNATGSGRGNGTETGKSITKRGRRSFCMVSKPHRNEYRSVHTSQLRPARKDMTCISRAARSLTATAAHHRQSAFHTSSPFSHQKLIFQSARDVSRMRRPRKTVVSKLVPEVKLMPNG